MIRMTLLMLAGTMVFGSAVCLAQEAAAKKKILMFSPSFGFRHSCVTRPLTGELSHAEKVFKDFAGQAGYEVLVSQDFRDLDDKGKFKQFDAIVFYTTGNPLINREGFREWLRGGGAFIGIHCATDTFHSDQRECAAGWPEYVGIIGGSFKTHGSQEEVAIKVEDPNHPATRAIPSEWRITDEIYLFNHFSRDKVHVLLSIDTSKTSDQALKGILMEKGGDYPVSWINTEGEGRVFYTSLAHREDVWTNPVFQKHLLGGISWALKQE